MSKKMVTYLMVGLLSFQTPVTCLGTEMVVSQNAVEKINVSQNDIAAQMVGSAQTEEEVTDREQAGISVSGTVITVTASSGEDISGTLDEALEQARDLATDEAPVTVKVPAGTYNVTQNMHIYSNTTLDLQGVTLKYTGSEPHNMLMTGTNGSYKGQGDYNNSSLCAGYGGFKNITVKGGIFQSSKSNTATVIRMAHATNVTLDSVTITGGGCAHQMEVAAIDGFYVKNCTFKDFGVSKTDDPDKQEALQLDIPCSSDVFKGVYTDGTVMKNVEITGCTFSDVPRGVGSHTSLNGAYHSNVKINNNTFNNITEEAIVGLNYLNCEIKSNKVTNSGAGILFQYFKSNTDSVYTTIFDKKQKYQGTIVYDAKTVIEGNDIQTKYTSTCDEIQGIKVYGVNLKNAKKGGDGKLVPANDYYISGVTVKNNAIVTAGHGIHMVDAKNCVVQGNKITGKNFSSSDPNKGKYDGIFVATGSDGVDVTGNMVADMVRNGIFTQESSFTGAVEKNTVTNCGGTGIDYYQKSGSKGEIKENTISNCKSGGILVSTDSVTGAITGNVLTGNKGDASINVYKDSTTGAIKNNKICDTGVKGNYQPAIKLTTGATSGDICGNEITKSANPYAAQNGILVYKDSKVSGSVTDNTMDALDGFGISITTDSAVTGNIEKNTIKSAKKSGIFVYLSSKVNGDIIGNNIKKATESGIYITGNATVKGSIEDNVVGKAGGKGIYLYNKSTAKAIKGNTITSAKSQGINVASVKNKMEISGNKVSKGSDNVILIQPNTTKYEITIKNNTLKGNKKKSAIRVTSGKVSVADNTISNVAYAVYAESGVKGNVYYNKLGSGVKTQLLIAGKKLKQNNKKVTVSSVKSSAKKKATVKWKKASGAAGYEVQYSTAKDFSKSVKTKGVSAGKTSVTLSKLKSKKDCYVRICSYKTVGGMKVYSNYSKVKKVKVK